jgi:hypothetical protein
MSRKQQATARERSGARRRERYPTPAEREQLVTRRLQLRDHLIRALVRPPGDAQDRQMQRLMQTYGPQDVALVLGIFHQTSLGRDLIGDEATVYRAYRRAFARFGGGRPFLSQHDYVQLTTEYARLRGRRALLSWVARRTTARQQELYELLLIDAPYWEDLTPLAVPPCPADFAAPRPATYHAPVDRLLSWGWDLERRGSSKQVAKAARGRAARAELLQMVLDAGLLNGWPGAAASWAPYHALELLRDVPTAEYAEPLLGLLDQPNDWLSDRLPLVWASMGPAAEAPLWAYLDRPGGDPRQHGVVLLGLKAIAQLHPSRRPVIVQALMQRLAAAAVDEAASNSYLVLILDRLQAIEAREVIAEAFQQQKVDLTIIGREDVEVLSSVR